MNPNPLLELREYGQSVWLDFLRRRLVESGELKRLIDEDGLGGITSNPKTFDKVIGGSDDYDEDICRLAADAGNAKTIYEALAIEDVRMAADVLRPLFDASDGWQGFVSLEVDPHLAHDTRGTIEEGRRLWQAIDRPNVFIEVPATRAGLPAIRQLIREGVNVNVTLLFGLPRYREVAESYLSGIEERLTDGKRVERVASVASFFLSPIDEKVDGMLDELRRKGGARAELAGSLRGQIAIASAKLAYGIYKETTAGDRFRKLSEKGARPQRLLWASTSTKDPSASNVKYVEALIGPDTINTMRRETLDAYRDHGRPEPRLERDPESARRRMEQLAGLGIAIENVATQLEQEGVAKFIQPFDHLMGTLEEKRMALSGRRIDPQALHLGDQERSVKERLAHMEREDFCARLWRKDPTLWTRDRERASAIRRSLGWLHVAEKMEEEIEDLERFAAGIRDAGFTRAVLLGMGGSSLAPLTMERSIVKRDGGLPLIVIDTTDPSTILAIERSLSLDTTLFIVASKSGTTAETAALEAYFHHRVRASKRARAGENFVAITDPGTPLAERAIESGYRRTFLNFEDIGGRYSALSFFGLVPAALAGIDLGELLDRSLRMLRGCDDCVRLEDNPGMVLGAVLGELARQGRDKVTFIVPDRIATLGLWLEQLLAESTGKEGRGILPVAGEAPGDPSSYGSDRLFVHIRMSPGEGAADDAVRALKDAGFPVVSVTLRDPHDLGQEFVRWEIATAAAGSILGINPFDQPNVQESKDNTNALLGAVREGRPLPEEKPAISQGPLRAYTQHRPGSLEEALKQVLAGARPGPYAAILAYLTEEPGVDRRLSEIRAYLRDRLRLATTVGYGPRYLHSTGQLHKGGPKTGIFLMLTADPAQDAEVPGEPFSFGMLQRAQALGDLAALRRHGRRVLRIHLGPDPGAGLDALESSLRNVLEVSRP